MFYFSVDFWEGFLLGVIVTWVILTILVILKFKPKEVGCTKPSNKQIPTVFIPDDEEKDW